MVSNYDSERVSPVLLARISGILGLIGIVTGAFSLGYVPSILIVVGNPAATLHNISVHETLYRSGFASHLLELLPNILGEIIEFILLRRVNGIVAAFALCCGFIGIAVEAVDLLIEYVPLQLAIQGNTLAAFSPEQLQATFAFSAQLQQAGLLLSFVFYGLDELAGGYLVFRSGFLPRFLGVLVGLAGLCYLTNGLLSFLAPSLDARLNPYIQVASLPGELGSSLWLTIVGLNVAKWKAWTAEPRGERSVQFSVASASF